jgi:hypothetical protein
VNRELRTAALIAGALGLIVSLYFALSPGGDDGATPATTVAQTTTEGTTTAPAPPEAAQIIRVSVPGDRAPTVKKFTVKQGRQVALVVTSALADEVHLHGYDLHADVAPGKPATIRFKANAPGLFEAELESRSLPIVELEVRP